MKLFDYIRDTKGEMKHVSWPTKNQAIGYTIIVLLVSIVLALYLGFFDYIFTQVIDRFFINNF
jgi:preprotein translocase subunit SecE